MAVASRKLVIIEDGVLTSMSVNQTFVKEFPFLANVTAANQSRGRSCCGRGQEARSRAMSNVKRAIANLDSAKRQRLKQLLNAQQIKVTYKDASGRVIPVVF